MVSEAPSRAASKQQPLGHDRLHHVYIRTVVDVLAVRPLKVRDGRLIKRRCHVREFMAAVGGMPLEGSEEARPTIVDPGLPGSLVKPDCCLPELLRALEGGLERSKAQVPPALKRAAEPELAVTESSDELALELFGGAPPLPALPAVRRTAATSGCWLAARGTAAAAPLISTGRLTAATLVRRRHAARGTAAATPGPGGAMVIAATLLAVGPSRKTTHGCWWFKEQRRARIYSESWRVRCGTGYVSCTSRLHSIHCLDVASLGLCKKKPY